MTDEGRRARPDRPGSRLRHTMQAARVVHPTPSIIVAGAAAVVAVSGGASMAAVGMLAIAMLGFQFSIGALNDVADADADALMAKDKPIPSGILSKRSAALVAGLAAFVGVAISATFGPMVVALGVAGWSCGVAYDLYLRRTGLGWLAFALALPLLLAWTWQATGSHPVLWPALLLVAGVAGPMIHLANGLVDPDTDARTGRRTLATSLGPRRSRITLSLLVVVVLSMVVVASSTQGVLAPGQTAAFLLGGTLAVTGAALAWASSRRRREAGWLLLAVGLIPIVAAWISS